MSLYTVADNFMYCFFYQKLNPFLPKSIKVVSKSDLYYLKFYPLIIKTFQLKVNLLFIYVYMSYQQSLQFYLQVVIPYCKSRILLCIKCKYILYKACKHTCILSQNINLKYIATSQLQKFTYFCKTLQLLTCL